MVLRLAALFQSCQPKKQASRMHFLRQEAKKIAASLVS